MAGTRASGTLSVSRRAARFEVDVKPTSAVLRGYQLALERLEVFHQELEYGNKAVAVQSLEAWSTAANSHRKVELHLLKEAPVGALALRAETYAAMAQHTDTGGQG
jgi:hypothetical protein